MNHLISIGGDIGTRQFFQGKKGECIQPGKA